MLEAWGVNTIIMCGAWTDDCLATTIFDAVDKYGYDVITVENGCATATIHGANMMKILAASTSLIMQAEQVIAHLKNHPELIEGNVRHTQTRFRHDPVLKENEALKARIAGLEAEIVAKS